MSNPNLQSSTDDPIADTQLISGTESTEASQYNTEEPRTNPIFRFAWAFIIATLCALVTGLGVCTLSFFIADYLSGDIFLQLLILANALVPLAIWGIVFAKAIK